MGAVVVVSSLGGAPGVTTLAVAVGTMWPTESSAAVVVEADSAGGDVAAWRGLSPSPGVAELAAAARHSAAVEIDVVHHGQELSGGLRVCPAPASADRAQAPIALLAQHAEVLRPNGDAVCVVDVGRLTPRSPAAYLARCADAVVLVSGDDSAQLKRLQESLPALRAGISVVGVVLAGRRESPNEVAKVMEIPVWARLPRDVRGAAFVRGERAEKRPRRRPLLAAARRVGQRLVEARASSSPVVGGAA